MSELVDRTFWKRLLLFVDNVQVNDMMSDEEQQYIIRTAKRNIEAQTELENLPQADVISAVCELNRKPELCSVNLYTEKGCYTCRYLKQTDL